MVPAGLSVKPLDLHLVNVASIPTGPTHGKVCLQPHPGDVLKSTPNVRKRGEAERSPSYGAQRWPGKPEKSAGSDSI